MFVSVESGESGWSAYVFGDKENPRDGATLIKGDLALGDAICSSTDYKSGQYFRIVLSFHKEENVSQELGREIAREFMEHLMHGYRKDEYHLDIVEHTDTDELHYHIRVPKLNLLTGTQLHYHYLSDIKRKDAIHKYMEIKHDLLSPFEKKRLVPDPVKKVEQINRWRADHKQKPFDLSNKKGRGEAEERISDYIQEAVKNGYLNTLEEVQAELVSMDFTIAKVGHDNGKDFDYITIENDTGKLRLKGDIYGERFYEHHAEDRAEAIRSQRSLEAGDRTDRGSLEQAKRELDKANRARSIFLGKRFKTARKNALRSQQAPTPGDRGGFGDKGNNKKEQRRKTGLGHKENRDRGNDREDQKQNRSIEDDRTGNEALKRVGELRERTRSRTRAYEEALRRVREEHQDIISRFDKEVSRELDNINTEREHRRGEFAGILENAHRAEPADYHAVAAAQRSRATQRATRRGFAKIVQRLANSLQHFERKVAERSVGIIERVGGYLNRKRTQEIERFKSMINLAEFVNYAGYQRDPQRSSRHFCLMQHEEGERIFVAKERESSQYHYVNLDNDHDSGSIVDFLKNRTDETIGVIRGWLRSWLEDPKPKEKIEIAPSSKESLKLAKSWEKIEESEVCMAQYWGLSNLHKLAALPNVKYDSKNGFFFAIENQEGICGIERWDHENREIIDGNSQGVFIVGDLEEAESIVLFESPVEMQSYKATGRPLYTACAVSIMGDAEDSRVETALKELFSENKRAQVVIATANDDIGDRIAQKVSNLLYEVDGDTKRAREDRPKTRGHDWNESHKAKKERAQSQNHGIRMRR